MRLIMVCSCVGMRLLNGTKEQSAALFEVCFARHPSGLYVGRRSAEISLATHFNYTCFNSFGRSLLQRRDSQKLSLRHHLAGKTGQTMHEEIGVPA